MFSRCQFAIYDTFTVSTLICHIETVQELLMIIGKKHTL